MLDKVSQMAEQVATNVSRREFLGRFGGAALGVAGVLGSLLVAAGTAPAAGNGHAKSVCYYLCPDGEVYALAKNNCNGCPTNRTFYDMSCAFFGCSGPPSF